MVASGSFKEGGPLHHQPGNDEGNIAVSSNAMRKLEAVNKELWLVLSMFVIALILNVVIDAQRMVLYFYTLPTIASAYLYGRRHSTLTAFASVLMVTLLTVTSPGIFKHTADAALPVAKWLDLAAWGGTLTSGPRLREGVSQKTSPSA